MVVQIALSIVCWSARLFRRHAAQPAPRQSRFNQANLVLFRIDAAAAGTGPHGSPLCTRAAKERLARIPGVGAATFRGSLLLRRPRQSSDLGDGLRAPAWRPTAVNINGLAPNFFA